MTGPDASEDPSIRLGSARQARQASAGQRVRMPAGAPAKAAQAAIAAALLARCHWQRHVIWHFSNKKGAQVLLLTDRRLFHSGVIPAALTTLPHFSVSSAWNVASSADVLRHLVVPDWV